MQIQTDYLVVGAGAAGLAFTDALVAASDADVVLVDRRTNPGGHWNDAYDFVRLHQPSAFYGVQSLTLGTDSVDTSGINAGFYERATAPEIRAYFARVLDDLRDTGRVRFIGCRDYAGGGDGTHTLTDRATGDRTSVTVRRRMVDATFLETSIPATHTPSFPIDHNVRFVPVNALAEVPDADGFTIVGGGKTSMDACSWLLDNGVPADAIRWIRPRDSWVLDRRYSQPLEQLATTMDGQARQLEAAAESETVAELFERLEAGGQFVRLDPEVEPTMYHCATLSQAEITQLRTITDVVRLGHVRAIASGRIHLTDGHIPTGPGWVHVDCSAYGLKREPSRPVFEPGRITPQPMRMCQPTFNCTVIGHVEATYGDDDTKNALCPPNRYPSLATDWMPNTVRGQRAQNRWGQDDELTRWMETCRVNTARGLRAQLAAGDPALVDAVTRMIRCSEPAIANLERLMATVPEG